MSHSYQTWFYLAFRGFGVYVYGCVRGPVITRFASIYNPTNSKWSSWISFYLLRGGSIWEIPCPGNYSWSWRKILGFSLDGKKFFYFHVGDGRSISLWFDIWHHLGLLVEFFRGIIIMDSNLGRDTRLRCIIAGKEWILPPPPISPE